MDCREMQQMLPSFLWFDQTKDSLAHLQLAVKALMLPESRYDRRQEW